MKKQIVVRACPDLAPSDLLAEFPILDRIYRARGVILKAELEKDLSQLLPFHSLKAIDQATKRLHQALINQETIVVIGDYDADGATSTAIAIRALRGFGFQKAHYLVPNRFKFGYGLSPEIVQLAHQIYQPQLIITVDNGIVSHAGVDLANTLKMDVIITDHHLPSTTLPSAYAIINPNQPGDEFPSKHLAGCGVIFYVMLALRAKLREVQWFEIQALPEPNMAKLLDIVALGTVADVVTLDKNNRTLVHAGIQRIRQGQCIPAIKVLLEIGKRQLARVVASDLGFAVAPRLNAAGRLEDMSIGVACLLEDDPLEATKLAFELERLNNERQVIEAEMKSQAFDELKKIDQLKVKESAIVLFNPQWHQGVIGILASRVKDRCHRPTIVFALNEGGELKGSARSISGFHIRDSFERIALKYPELIHKYGGHAMAAGLTIAAGDLALFQEAFYADAALYINQEDLTGKILCDGELSEQDFMLPLAQAIRWGGPWGQGFPEPLFANRFRVIEQRIVGSHHLKLILGLENKLLSAIWFNVDVEQWPNHRCEYVQAAYKLDVNEYQGRTSVQLMVEYMEPVA